MSQGLSPTLKILTNIVYILCMLCCKKGKFNGGVGWIEEGTRNPRHYSAKVNSFP